MLTALPAKRADDVAEGREGLIDELGLLESLACRGCIAYALAPREVDHVHTRSTHTPRLPRGGGKDGHRHDEV